MPHKSALTGEAAILHIDTEACRNGKSLSLIQLWSMVEKMKMVVDVAFQDQADASLRLPRETYSTYFVSYKAAACFL